MIALLLAVAMTGQATSYNLIVTPAPAADPVAVEQAKLMAAYRIALEDADAKLEALRRQVERMRTDQLASQASSRSRVRLASDTTASQEPAAAAAYPANPSLAMPPPAPAPVTFTLVPAGYSPFPTAQALVTPPAGYTMVLPAGYSTGYSTGYTAGTYTAGTYTAGTYATGPVVYGAAPSRGGLLAGMGGGLLRGLCHR